MHKMRRYALIPREYVLAGSANRTRKFNRRGKRHRDAWRLEPVIHSRSAEFARREPTSLKVHLALLAGMGEQMRYAINARSWHFASRREGLHNDFLQFRDG